MAKGKGKDGHKGASSGKKAAHSRKSKYAKGNKKK